MARRGTFTEAEVRYLQDGRKLGRVATVGRNGTPHVVPTGWQYNPGANTIDVTGRDVPATRKFRDVRRNARASIVIDDLASTDPWRPRAVEIRGRAEALQAEGIIRIYPEEVVSWGLV